MKKLAALFLVFVFALAAGVPDRPQRRLPRQAGAPQAPRVLLVAGGATEALVSTLEAVLSEDGFEVSTGPFDSAPAATLVLRATSGAQPLIVFDGESSGAMARAMHRGLPGARLDECRGCLAGQGGPTVVVELGEAAGSAATQMDAALAVRDALRPLAAAGARTAPKAEMTSPAPGATLSGSTATFQWSAGDQASQYWLMIGTWLGGDTIYSADQGTLTSAPVSGLPTDGRTIYVRLWSYVNGQWVSNDYQYKAYAAGGVTPAKAAITSPAAGSTLGGAAATFQWNAGTGVSRYYLFVGLWAGGNTIYSQDMAANLQATVPNLPTDGSTVYVRLWSYIDAGWQYNDYTFKAAGTLTPAKAAMTTPAAGSTLAGSSAAFQWSAGTAVTRYYLFVGKWQGGNTLFSQDMGTSTSANVTGLPVDASTVYVRLWSYIAGQWQYNDYTYTAAGSAPVAAKAALTAPAPGSTLAGTSAAFTWTAGSSVQRYWLFVGTTQGNNDIYGADQGTNTSATVAGLPVNGKVLYVRLWSYLNGGWQYNDYSYRAAGQ
jgi:hypothetical protein